MPLLIQRTYQLASASHEVDHGSSSSSAAAAAADAAAVARDSGSVTTSTCHRWSCVDVAHRATCLVTLLVHHSLHVDVGAEVAGAPTAATAAASIAQPQRRPSSSNGNVVDWDSGHDGLCGYTWELLWIPDPDGDATAAAAVARHSVRARFHFPRTVPLASATLQGTGGVVFLDGRHVLIATEASAADGSGRPRGDTSCALDSFVLRDSAAMAGTQEAAAASTSTSLAWTRVSASVLLPCPFAAAPPAAPAKKPSSSSPSVGMAQRAARPTSKLVLLTAAPAAGVVVPATAASPPTPAVAVRLVYLTASQCTRAAGDGSAAADGPAWDLVGGVVDLHCADPALCGVLEVRLRHATCVHRLSLALEGEEGPSASTCSATPLQPSALLWALVPDVPRPPSPAAPCAGGGVSGSLIALLPCAGSCSRGGAPAAVEGWPMDVGPTEAAASPQPPAVVCMGFRDDTPHGAVGVASVQLDRLARAQGQRLEEEQQQQQQQQTSTTASSARGRRAQASAQELLERLLPSAERAVYEVSLGGVTQCIGAAASAGSPSPRLQHTVLSAHTSVLRFHMHGVQPGAAGQRTASPDAVLPEGLYRTSTPSWGVVASYSASASASARVHRVPLARTMWCALDPLVLPTATQPGAVHAESHENATCVPLRTQHTRGHSWPLSGNDGAWALGDVDRWGEWLAGEEASAGGSLAARTAGAAAAAAPAAYAAPATAFASLTGDTAELTTCVSVPSAQRSDVQGYPCLNPLTQSLTMWYCWPGGAAEASREDNVALVRPPPPPLPPSARHAAASPTAQVEWEAAVAEWVAAEHIYAGLRAASPRGGASAPPDAAEARDAASGVAGAADLAAVITYRAMRMLWAFAVMTPASGASSRARWPPVLMDVVRSTAADAAQNQTRLPVYARAVQTFTTAHLASSCTAAELEVEGRHLRRAAGVFMRLVLRTLLELDWRGADAGCWRCKQWLVHWLLGCGAATAAPHAEGAAATAAAEGRAMQVLLHLAAAEGASTQPTQSLGGHGAAAPAPLDWLRRALLLYACRNTQLPLELMVEDLVEASGLSLMPPVEAPSTASAAAAADGWGDDSDADIAGGDAGAAPHELAELRASMEYALLRLVQPQEVYGAMQLLACASAVAPRTAAHLVVHGVLSIADLHALLCADWTPGQPREAAPPPGFSFVCSLVDAAMRYTSSPASSLVAVGGGSGSAAAAAAATAAGYEHLAVTALDAWGAEGDDPVTALYPLLNPVATGAAGTSTTVSSATSVACVLPFPFSVLPPLLTVYLWYHVADRLCTALQLLPPKSGGVGDGFTTASPAPPHATATTGEEEAGSAHAPHLAELAPCLRGVRARDGARLQALHRGVCVLRCLTQEDPACAEELFAAIRLVHAELSHDAVHCGGPHSGAGAWADAYLVAWQSLLAVETPPLTQTDALLAYRERTTALAGTPQSRAAVLRALHYVYASAGSGHVLRAQIARAGGPPRHLTTSPSHAVLVDTLQRWRLAALPRASAMSLLASSPARDGADDVVGPWLVQVWANVLVCERDAATDVGVYEHLFTALAHAKQQQQQRGADSLADTAFALLRPCLLYALQVVQQLAVQEELRTESGAITTAAAAVAVCPQLNEALTWSGTSPSGHAASATATPRAPERLCAGEVYERVRRQLRRLVALFEIAAVVPNGASAAGARMDVRFSAIAQLLAQLPSAEQAAAVQRRWMRRQVESTMPPPPSPSARVASAAVAASALSSRSRSRSRSTSSSSGDDEADEAEEGHEPVVELTPFSLSPTAAYVIAAVAHTAQQQQELRQQQQAGGIATASSLASSPSALHSGWLVVACEVVRRELTRYTLMELFLNGFTAAAPTQDRRSGSDEGDAAPASPEARPAPQWRLAASEAQLKAFTNALAEAVEPLTAVLTQSMVLQPATQSLVLLLVLDVLHGLFLEGSATATQPGADAATTVITPPPTGASAAATIVSAEPAILHQLRHWIRGVAAPRYTAMDLPARRAVLQPLTDDFAHAYLRPAAGDEGVAGGCRSEAAAAVASYRDSEVHWEWRQWRAQQRLRITHRLAMGGKTLDMLSCFSACVMTDSRPLLFADLPQRSSSSAAAQLEKAVSSSAAPPSPRTAAPDASGAVAAAAALGATWIDAGSVLRTTLFHTIGAVAPRSSPQPALPAAEPRLASATPSPAPPPSMPATPYTTPTTASRVPDGDALPLLRKEEAFKRRQRAGELARAQQDFFASDAFQHALVQLYAAMRAEKRRRELLSFALDQHDLICAFASREALLLRDAAREGLRHAWCEWGERQRLAVRRLLQAERDARMGVQAVAHAERASVVDAARQERRVWALYEEGRAGLAAMEEDTRDALAVAAARAHVELARRAAEAEEEAYWRVEEEAWARGEADADADAGAARAPATAAASQPVASADIAGEQHGPRAGPSATAPPNLARDPRRSRSVSPVVPPSPPLKSAAPRPVAGGAEGEKAEGADAGPRAGTGWDGAAGGLFTALSRWQTALRETVAPPPPSHTAAAASPSASKTTLAEAVVPATTSGIHHAADLDDDEGRLTSLVSHRVVRGGATAQPNTADAVRTRIPSPPPPRAATKVGDDSGWGWSSDSDADAAAPPTRPRPTPTFVPLQGTGRGRLAATAAAAGPSAQDVRREAQPLPPPPPPPPPRLPVTATAAAHPVAALFQPPLPAATSASSHATDGVGAATAAPSTKPPRKKKGFAAAAVLVAPVTSTTSASTSTVAPPEPCASHAVDDATTPDPVRCILPAVEAAAVESASNPRFTRAAHAALTAYGAHTPSRPTATLLPPNHVGEAKRTAGAGAAGPSARVQPSGDDWGWSDDEDTGREEEEERVQHTTPSNPATAAVAAVPSRPPAGNGTSCPHGPPIAGTPPSQTRAEQASDDGWGWTDDEDARGVGGGMSAGAAGVAALSPPLPRARPSSSSSPPPTAQHASARQREATATAAAREDGSDWGWDEEDRRNDEEDEEERHAHGGLASVTAEASQPPPPPPPLSPVPTGELAPPSPLRATEVTVSQKSWPPPALLVDAAALDADTVFDDHVAGAGWSDAAAEDDTDGEGVRLTAEDNATAYTPATTSVAGVLVDEDAEPPLSPPPPPPLSLRMDEYTPQSLSAMPATRDGDAETEERTTNEADADGEWGWDKDPGGPQDEAEAEAVSWSEGDVDASAGDAARTAAAAIAAASCGVPSFIIPPRTVAQSSTEPRSDEGEDGHGWGWSEAEDGEEGSWPPVHATDVGPTRPPALGAPPPILQSSLDAVDGDEATPLHPTTLAETAVYEDANGWGWGEGDEVDARDSDAAGGARTSPAAADTSAPPQARTTEATHAQSPSKSAASGEAAATSPAAPPLPVATVPQTAPQREPPHPFEVPRTEPADGDGWGWSEGGDGDMEELNTALAAAIAAPRAAAPAPAQPPTAFPAEWERKEGWSSDGDDGDSFGSDVVLGAAAATAPAVACAVAAPPPVRGPSAHPGEGRDGAWRQLCRTELEHRARLMKLL